MGGDYAAFIWSAYAATGLTVAGLIAWAVLDHQAQLRALARFESGAAREAEPGRSPAMPSPSPGQAHV